MTDIVTVDDLRKYVRYNSTIKFLFTVNRCYAMKNQIGNASHKLYGVTLKLTQIICDEFVKYNTIPDECLIEDSDNDN